jgi:UDP-3-O-[3-hydroxymyristoyl] glucosamine N-acyltransferase
VTLREGTVLGNRVILQPGVVLGGDGFGYAKNGSTHHKVPQIGRVVIEDDVEIGANTCVDRATTGETRIKRGTKIDNLVQVAHNVVLGENCVIAAQVGISGSTEVGNHVVMGGQAGVGGHLVIGDRVVVGGLRLPRARAPGGQAPLCAHRPVARTLQAGQRIGAAPGRARGRRRA